MHINYKVKGTFISFWTLRQWLDTWCSAKKQLLHATACNQETVGVIPNSSYNHQQENSKYYIIYYIIVCNTKPAEVTTHASSADWGLSWRNDWSSWCFTDALVLGLPPGWCWNHFIAYRSLIFNVNKTLNKHRPQQGGFTSCFSWCHSSLPSLARVTFSKQGGSQGCDTSWHIHEGMCNVSPGLSPASIVLTGMMHFSHASA